MSQGEILKVPNFVDIKFIFKNKLWLNTLTDTREMVLFNKENIINILQCINKNEYTAITTH